MTILSTISHAVLRARNAAQVFSSDMFQSRFAPSNLLNPLVGLEYRRKVLQVCPCTREQQRWRQGGGGRASDARATAQPGGTREAIDLVRDFLGRDPTPAAFYAGKGLIAAAADA